MVKLHPSSPTIVGRLNKVFPKRVKRKSVFTSQQIKILQTERAIIIPPIIEILLAIRTEK